MMNNIPKSIDLHGLTIDRGFNKALMFIKVHHFNGSDYCKIITGKSGKMKKEFSKWMEHPFIKGKVKSWKTFDDRGSYLVRLGYK